MPSQKDIILLSNQYMQSNKISYINYADLKSLIKKIDGCANNQEKSSATKIGKLVPSVYSMSTIWAFDTTGNKHSLYRGEDCVKKFCSSLRKHTINVINFERKKMLPLIKKS